MASSFCRSRNISFLKGLARKLVPKFIGPYKLVKDFGNNSYKVDLPSELKKRGVHNIFHSSLLQIHIPNDDQLFPGCTESQFQLIANAEGEWAVDQILSHSGSRTDSIFEVLWCSGNQTWLPFNKCEHLIQLQQYLEVLDAPSISKLPAGLGTLPQDDPQVSLHLLGFNLGMANNFFSLWDNDGVHLPCDYK
jgi:hypothetical protein